MMLLGFHISDIHINPNNYSTIIDELTKEFIYRMRVYGKIDYITINGDLFDYELSLNSPASRAIIDTMDVLANIATEKNIKIRCIKGTKFHDNNQWRIFNKYEKYKDLDFKIIETVTKEELFPDFKVLYIPEEYMSDYMEYYKEYFNEEYNLICGHGMFKEVSFEAQNQEGVVTMKKAPIFDSDLFRKIAIGPVIFGHVHKPTVIKGFIYYTGSFSRSRFGEEEKKGFSVSLYDTDSYKYVVEFIENTLAPRYDTIVYSSNDIVDNDVEKVIKEIENSIVDRLRVRINFKGNSDIEKVNMTLIKNYFSSNKNVTIDIKNVGINNSVMEERKSVNELKDRYSYLFEGMEIEDEIHEFINKDFNVFIPSERIKYHLDI